MRPAKHLHNRSRPRPRRLRLECLEDRAVPATFLVNTPLDELTPGDGRLSLREAITAANDNPGADTIILRPGVYAMAIPGANENDNASGDFDVTDNLVILGFGPRLTTIDARQMDRVFELNGAISVAFVGVTLQGGAETHGAGGVEARDTNVTLIGCTVTGNQGKQGGGIDSEGGNVTLFASTVRGNTAEFDGGGIRAANTLTMMNSTVSGNTGLLGGGIAAGMATLTGCTVSGNTASFGGGIAADTVTMTNCTIAGNTAGTGGGIDAGTANLLNCTVARNSAHIGGGLLAEGFGAFGLRNTIVALNVADVSDPDVSGNFSSGGHNLIGDGTGGTGFVASDMVGTAANPIDPKLGPLQNNGGLTQTMALRAGSPAIDAGDNNGVPATDQRGLGRIRDGNGDGIAVVDIGAFER